jgi:hypothetical protein
LAPRGSGGLAGERSADWLLIRFLLHFEPKYLIRHQQ